MVWSDKEIGSWGKRGGVEPFNVLNVNPGSLDLTLGGSMRLPMWYWCNPVTRFIVFALELFGIVPWFWLDNDYLAKKGQRRYQRWGKERTLYKHILWPGDFVLCCSSEYTKIPTNAVATLYSKSSSGRIGLEHLHAGYGDQGFEGQWTWELSNMAPWPIILERGTRLMQVVLTEAEVPDKDYSKTGRYQGQTGATPVIQKELQWHFTSSGSWFGE